MIFIEPIEKEEPTLVQEGNMLILGIWNERGKLSHVRELLKASIQVYTSLTPPTEKTMEVQIQAQVNDIMEVQVHVHKVNGIKVLPLKVSSLLALRFCLLKVSGVNLRLGMS